MSFGKPVNDRTIQDINQANRDMWDAGPRVDTAADGWSEEAQRAAEKGAPFKQHAGPLTEAQTEYGEKRKKDLRSIGINPTEGEHMNRRAIIARHPQNDAEDVRHPKGAASQHVRNDVVVAEQHDGYGIGEEMDRRVDKEEARDAVHLPRNPKRQWRKTNWS